MKYTIKWKPSYAIGIESIDEQHKHLFDLVEEAVNLLELPDHVDKYDDIIPIIEKLKEYVVYHFQEEEKIMLEIKYKKYFSHRIRHHDFIEEMEKIDVYKIDENQKEELLKIVGVLTEWLVQHVLDEDADWANHYKEYYKEQA